MKAIVTAFSLLLPLGVTAASFDCRGKLSSVEQSICESKVLSALDHRLNALYSLAVALDKSPQSVRAQQREWIARQRNACGDTACLSVAYRRRVDDLTAAIQARAEAIPAKLAGEASKPATKSAYCQASGGGDGESFKLNVQRQGARLQGEIDGFADCGRKVWGPTEFQGEVVANLALVKLRVGWSEDQQQDVEALIVISSKKIYWRMLTEIEVESYVPTAQALSKEGK